MRRLEGGRKGSEGESEGRRKVTKRSVKGRGKRREEVENWRESVRKGRRGDEGNRERKESERKR